MTRRRWLAMLLLATSGAAVPQAQAPDRALVEALGRIYRLRDYTAFDWIAGRYNRGTLTLQGFARTESLKQQAERTAKDAAGIDTVINEIEVLPTHRGDDDIRVRAYAAIYTSAALERYAPGGQLSGSALRELAESGFFGLDAVDVGRGPHAIHIIVNGSRVLLLGQVRTTGDRTIAQAQVRSIPGVITVTNQLRVAGEKR